MNPTADRVAGLLASPAVRWFARLALVAWMGVIFALSSVPGGALPGRYGQLAHLLEYALFGALAYVSVRRAGGGRRAAAIAVLLAAVYAVTDEFHQYFVPGRTVDVADWGTDVVGALLGAALIRLTDGMRAA